MLDDRAGNRAIARVEWPGFVPDDVAAAPAAAMACLSQRLVERIAGAGGRPQHAGVGDQCEAERLVGLVAEAANVALMGYEQVAAQRVQALARVELAAYTPPEFFAGDVAADAVGAHEPTVLVQCLDQGARPAAGVQPGDEQAGGDVPGVFFPRW